ncbi:MAG: hypothetical protein H0T42_06440 [Deltaproteobacteria bacterium]|nr:hypothetical protein [Deltaproteobacteria bacterium]
MLARTTLAILIAAISVASAQPADPYGPAQPADPYGPGPTPAPAGTPSNPTPAPGPDDPVLAEQIALDLVMRAQQLFDARVFVDAKQLAVEALVKSPKGAAAEHARFLIKLVNKQLGITDAPDPTNPDVSVDVTPIQDPAQPVAPPAIPPQPEVPGASGARTAARVHGALYTGLLGATIGSFFSEKTPVAGAVPVGIATGLVGGLYLPRLIEKREWTEAQIRTTGSGSVWGGVLGGLFADAVGVDSTGARHVLVGASIGSTMGLLGGAALASTQRMTRGDVALVDTLAGVGAVGGLTMGMLMQPAEGEAYSVNAILGTAAGFAVGMVAGPQTNTTQRRMLRVAGVAAAGGAAPFLLYAAIYDRDGNADERAVGALSSIGLVAGLYVGFRMTANLDVGLDVHGAPQVEDAPAAIVGRHSDGRWSLGALSITTLSPELAPQPGLAIPFVAGAF